jgi:hypothetical protein
MFELQLRALNLPAPQAEYKFHPTRRWRFDYAWPEFRCALEVEGGVWSRGRHTRGSGFRGDMEKYNTGTCEGWAIVRCEPSDLRNGKAVKLVEELLACYWHRRTTT